MSACPGMTRGCFGRVGRAGNYRGEVHRKRAEALYFDGTGLCLLCKRLEIGHFAAPWTRPGEGPLVLTMNELRLLLEGSELALRVRLSPEPYRPMPSGAHT